MRLGRRVRMDGWAKTIIIAPILTAHRLKKSSANCTFVIPRRSSCTKARCMIRCQEKEHYHRQCGDTMFAASISRRCRTSGREEGVPALFAAIGLQLQQVLRLGHDVVPIQLRHGRLFQASSLQTACTRPRMHVRRGQRESQGEKPGPLC